jgi:hypothetical protein
MILEINDQYAAELEEASHTQDAAVVAELVHTHLVSALPENAPENAPEPPLLTVGHVLARIHADAAQHGRVERGALEATRPHQSAETPLPSDLSLRGVSQLLEQLGVQVSRRFQNLFRETAIYMRMGRNQGMARMAATRQQQARRQQLLHESSASYEAKSGSAPTPTDADRTQASSGHSDEEVK